MWNKHATTGLGGVAPLVAVALPVFEVMLSVIRRFLRNQPVFGSDRNHIHHRIQALGLSQKKSALILYGFSLLAATLAVLQTILRPRLASVLLVAFLLIGVAGLRMLRYREFGIVGRFLFRGEFRRALRATINITEYEEYLASAKTIDECWVVLKNACKEANFKHVSLHTGDMHFEAEFRPPSGSPSSHYTITLGGAASATFGYDDHTPSADILVVPLAERFHAKLKDADIRWAYARDLEPAARLRSQEAAAS
jgi:UDP-GlcNAc:undecaprenyl-phosphate GlcNAc-1-phosphate transferase